MIPEIHLFESLPSCYQSSLKTVNRKKKKKGTYKPFELKAWEKYIEKNIKIN